MGICGFVRCLTARLFAHSAAVEHGASRCRLHFDGANNGGMSGTLLHICPRDEWLCARDTRAVTPPSLDDVGFVHLSTPDQVHLPANRLFHGRTDLVLLCIDPSRLIDDVRFEPGVPEDPESMRFPHLYGPLPVDAVVDVVDYRPGDDGRFSPL